MLDTIILPIKLWAEGLITQMGPVAIAFLMFLDSANIPIPSEVIMPFGGILAAEGKMSFLAVGAAGTIGTVLGSILNYFLGMKLGPEGVIKYGKFLLIRRKEVEHGEKWFEKYGDWVTLWGRFIPLVRTFISLPAGIYRMNFGRFVLFAFLGATPWCFGWAYIGFKMGENWSVVEKNWKYVDYIVVAGLVFLIGKWLYSRIKEKNNEKMPA
ncbi:MAG: DedA family protein [Armatimonadetes bacterium]|nr:DedA family protein [Armatimonadota bacterium]